MSVTLYNLQFTGCIWLVRKWLLVSLELEPQDAFTEKDIALALCAQCICRSQMCLDAPHSTILKQGA